MKKLTDKQEKFAQLVVSLGNQSEAYRQAYDVRPTVKKDTVEFKGVPQKASEPIKKLKPTTTEREIPIDITKLSWAKFKQYCKQELGLKVHGKKRAELMEEIELMNM